MAKFKFAKGLVRFWAPVTIITPGGDEQEFNAQFIYFDDKTWIAKTEKSTVGEILREIWTGWEGIVDDGDSELPFSTEARDALMLHSYIVQPVMAAYRAARDGLRAKN